MPGACDRRFGLLARRVEQRQYAGKLPLTFLIRPGHAQGAEAAAGKLVDRLLYGGLDLTGVARHLQYDLRRSLGHEELCSVCTLYGSLGALMHWVEGLEVDNLIVFQRLIVLYAADHSQIDGVLVLRARS